jgi:sister chromatid cohesion protein DCC1
MQSWTIKTSPKYRRFEINSHSKSVFFLKFLIFQAIYYPNSTGSSNIKLLELDPEMLAELENGNQLVFKGALHEKVVLCTRNKTFEVRNAEQTNSLLVVPDLLLAQATSDSPLKSPTNNNINKSLDRSLESDDESSQITIQEHEIQHKPILKIFYDYMECRQVKPRFKKIQDLLHMTPYTGPENEHLVERKMLFTRRQLFDTAQCSSGEFDELLRRIRCIRIDDFMRLLDYGYEYRVVALMLSLITENSWNLDEVDRAETIAALDGIIPNEITEAVFDFYTAESTKFQYNEEMVCRIIALNVLKEGLKFHIEEFLETCQGALPEGMEMKETYLAGIGVIDRDSQAPSVRGLFEENLPVNLADRLKILFKTKEKWTLQQIAPYVELFTTPKLGVTSLLAKHVRSVVENGTRLYVAKHQ